MRDADVARAPAGMAERNANEDKMGERRETRDKIKIGGGGRMDRNWNGEPGDEGNGVRTG